MAGILQDYYDEFRMGYWADPDPKVCLCRGSGYALSDVDTWHECPIHFKKGQRHPEDPYPDEMPSPEEMKAVMDECNRNDPPEGEPCPSPEPYKPLTDDDIPF